MIVECKNCNRRVEININSDQEYRLKCIECGNKGTIVSNKEYEVDLLIRKSEEYSLDRPQIIDPNICIRCGEIIPEIRLMSKPGTRLHLECEYDNKPSSDKKRFIHEPLGSREAFKRDRASWKKRH